MMSACFVNRSKSYLKKICQGIVNGHFKISSTSPTFITARAFLQTIGVSTKFPNLTRDEFIIVFGHPDIICEYPNSPKISIYCLISLCYGQTYMQTMYHAIFNELPDLPIIEYIDDSNIEPEAEPELDL